MHTITIDISKATKDQALAVIAQLNRVGVAYEIGIRVEVHEAESPDAAPPAKPRERKPPTVTDDVASKLLAAVENTDGAVSSILSRSGLTESQVQRGLRALREADKVFMVGSRRFARYGLTAEQPTERSEAAQGKTS